MWKKILSLFEKKEKTKEFTFSVTEAPCVGDKYSYTIKASSREEALEKLVRYFVSSEGFCSSDVETEHWTVVYQAREVFVVEGMPEWFARYLLGRSKEGDRRLLEEYCLEKGIKRN